MLGNGALSLTNPDEVFYAQTAKEMMHQKSWMTPYLFGQPQFEKPIFTYWLLRFGFEVFGVSSFSARLFPALWGILGVLAVYGLGLAAFKDGRRAMWAAFFMMSNSLYIGLSRTVFTDLFFTVFILFSLASFYWGYSDAKKKGIGILLFFVFSALAVLTKGPLGFLIPVLTALSFLLFRKELRFLFCKETILGFLTFCLIAVPWYALMIIKYGLAFMQEFFYNDHIRRLFEAEHLSNDTWFFYPVSVIGCMFPWSFYLISGVGHWFRSLRSDKTSFYIFLTCWVAVVLLIFQPAHSKLVSYIFPLFPALALFLGDYIVSSLDTKPSRLFCAAAWMTTLFLLLVPAGLFFATIRFSTYVINASPVYIFMGVFVFYLFWLFYYLMRRRFAVHMALISAVLPLLLYFAFLVHEDFQSYASSKEACEFLTNNYRVDNTILASKFYARGVRFYTDKDVVIIDISGSGFFSPHPVPYFNTDEKVRDFLRRQPKTYAILKKGNVKDIRRIAGDEFSDEVLEVLGDEYVVRITKK
jgi:4-amino-4-deoxy-L-arabinose transferase-like glycosyltransferase